VVTSCASMFIDNTTGGKDSRNTGKITTIENIYYQGDPQQVTGNEHKHSVCKEGVLKKRNKRGARKSYPSESPHKM